MLTIIYIPFSNQNNLEIKTPMNEISSLVTIMYNTTVIFWGLLFNFLIALDVQMLFSPSQHYSNMNYLC